MVGCSRHGSHGSRAREGQQSARSRSRRSRRKSHKARKRDKEKATPHFSWEEGLGLGPECRFVVRKLLGDGTFGRVLGCQDTVSNDYVAVKVVKGVRRYCEHAEAEAEILQEIQRLDTKRQSLCVELREHFLHAKQHFCMVFEPLDVSIRDFLKANGSLGLFLADVRQLAQQLLQSLTFLHSIGLTHTDLKCRNVMLHNGSFDLAPHPRVKGSQTRRPRSCKLAVIDFGGAVFPQERHPGRVGTRQFRAPEIVLGLPWDETSDLWSAGCIVAMIYIGQRPFSVHEDMEHLAMMERLLETEIPRWMAREAFQDEPPEGVSFDADWHLAWPGGAPEEEAIERVRALPTLREWTSPHHGSFLSLLKGLLEMDPQQRLAAAAGLQHPFLTDAEVIE